MTSSNATITLVPGAFYNPDYFSTFQAQLERRGFHTIAIALLSVGSDDPASCSAQKDADFIRNTAIVPLVDEGKQVVILMHSYGVIPGSAARGLGEEQRSREGLQGGVVGLIYISAFLVPADTTPLAAIGGSFPPEFAVIEGVSNTSTILDIHSAHVHLLCNRIKSTSPSQAQSTASIMTSPKPKQKHGPLSSSHYPFTLQPPN